MASVPEIRFAPARRGRIAYQCFGEGDATIVAIPPSAQNIEVAWEDERIAAMLRRFAGFSRYLHFDKLGTGSSDRSVPVAGLDERVDDLRDVMDHAGIDRAHLFGQSEGGPMTLLFAASYPDRVASVTLVGSYARLAPDPLSDELRAQITERQREFSQRWGTPSPTWSTSSCRRWLPMRSSGAGISATSGCRPPAIRCSTCCSSVLTSTFERCCP
ncbi:MAG: alpha/beta hydrolase [Acidimicrobiales bacterium]